MVALIRVDTIQLAVEPLDMRAGAEMIFTRVVKVFGTTRLHHVYLFVNRSSTHMEVLAYDGSGIWLTARRPNKGRFIWTNDSRAIVTALNPEQLRALVTGLPWQTLTHDHAITVV